MELNDRLVIDKLNNDFIVDWGIDIINAPFFWNHTKGENIKICLIDTGVNINHPDLKHSIKNVYNPINQNTNVDDLNGHGTAVAGLLVGKRTGVAPCSELYVVKALQSNGLGEIKHVLDGITFAISSKVDIICMSLGAQRKLPLIIEERIIKAYNMGISIISAVGNRGINEIDYPAYYDNVIAVGGVDKNLQRTLFSNYGRQLDVSAPCTNILTTYKDNNYCRMTGTSMASPIVAGSIALIKSYYKKQGTNLSANDIKSLLNKLGNIRTVHYGHGVMNLCSFL